MNFIPGKGFLRAWISVTFFYILFSGYYFYKDAKTEIVAIRFLDEDTWCNESQPGFFDLVDDKNQPQLEQYKKCLDEKEDEEFHQLLISNSYKVFLPPLIALLAMCFANWTIKGFKKA